MATTDKLTVAGIRFRTRADYEAALRDQKKIDAIKAKVDFDNPRQVYRLYAELQSGSYRFETQVGNNFDDEIYEKVEDLKREFRLTVTAVPSGKRKKKESLSEKATNVMKSRQI